MAVAQNRGGHRNGGHHGHMFALTGHSVSGAVGAEAASLASLAPTASTR
jgi:hypothetical protein